MARRRRPSASARSARHCLGPGSGHTAIGRVHPGMVVFGGALRPRPRRLGPVAVLAALALAGGIRGARGGGGDRTAPGRCPRPDPVRRAGVADSAMVSAAAVGSLPGPLLVSLWGGAGLLVGLAVATAVAGFVALPTVVRASPGRPSTPDRPPSRRDVRPAPGWTGPEPRLGHVVGSPARAV